MTGTPERPDPRTVRTRARADLLFAIYAQLGSERSLAKVADLAAAAGVKTAASSLARYSSDYGWVERASEFDRMRAEALTAASLRDAISQDVQHAQMGRALQQVGMQVVVEMTQSAERRAGTRLNEATRAIEVGVATERRASGRATEISEMILDLWDVVGPQQMLLWQQVLREMFDRLGDAQGPGHEAEYDAARRFAMMRIAEGTDRLADSALRHWGHPDGLLLPAPEAV